MSEFSLHPNVYSTGPHKGLLHMLEGIWVRNRQAGIGNLVIISGFANYNGGVRFYETFRRHTDAGGRITAFFAGSTSARLTSKQVVTELLNCGAEVHIVNRKKLLHAKCYGFESEDDCSLIVSSGNFTGPGMTQNVEASLLLDGALPRQIGFSWTTIIAAMLGQGWDVHQPSLQDLHAPAWRLLYDEQAAGIVLDDTEQVTMLLLLGHADTVRINAPAGSTASRGSQYFWLSKDCYGFFPPLTIRNVRGHKATYSTEITMDFIDLGTVRDCRVTFEAENNLDFRLGTGPLRNTRVAAEGDLAAITRTGEDDYQLRIFRQGTQIFNRLIPHAVNFIGHQGKRYGFIGNADFRALL